jgi:alpha-mannosidase
LEPIVLNVKAAQKGLPLNYSFAGVNANNIIISTIKKSEDNNSIIMRLVDMQGKPADATINWFGKINAISKTNIIEEEDVPLNTKIDNIHLLVNPYSIETIRLK